MQWTVLESIDWSSWLALRKHSHQRTLVAFWELGQLKQYVLNISNGCFFARTVTSTLRITLTQLKVRQPLTVQYI